MQQCRNIIIFSRFKKHDSIELIYAKPALYCSVDVIASAICNVTTVIDGLIEKIMNKKT